MLHKILGFIFMLPGILWIFTYFEYYLGNGKIWNYFFRFDNKSTFAFILFILFTYFYGSYLLFK